jgi:hypothetical protein
MEMFTRESTIRRDAEGRWFHDGALVENEAIARAFDRWIDVAEDGRFILKNSINWVYVTIEGAPFFVTAVDFEGSAAFLSLSDATRERLAIDTLRQDPAGALYCSVRGGRFAAKFSRNAQFDLEPVVGEDGEGVYLSLDGARVRPPLAEDPLKTPK